MRYLLYFMDYGSCITSKKKKISQTQTQTLSSVTGTQTLLKGECLMTELNFDSVDIVSKFPFFFHIKTTTTATTLIDGHPSRCPLQPSR